MGFEVFLQAAVTLGLSSALTMFFVWQSHIREQRMATRIDNLEDFQRNQLVSLCDKTTAALIEDASASRANVVVLADLQRSLKEHHEFAVQLEKNLTKRQ